MLLSQLAEVLPEAAVREGWETIEISGVTDDSRRAGPGVLFVALRGAHTDGHEHIPDAVKRGAVAVISEKRLELEEAVVIGVSDSTEALAKVAARFYEYPSEQMTLVGVTGTNGKTTTSLLIQSILEAGGKRSGLIGTLRYEVGEETLLAVNTTPNALFLQSLLRRMRGRRLDACVMEVSSHALSLGRVRECRFDVRIFTNLSRDHLDFHRSMEAYYEAKRLLFEAPFGKEEGGCVINADDPWGRRLIGDCPGRVWSFGIDREADVRAIDITNSIEGLSFGVETPRGPLRVESPLVGVYNIYNILAAVTAAFVLEIPEREILRGISAVTHIPGRFETVPGPGFAVVIDYAHTDDALKRLLQNARGLCRGRLITVFGCGGDRDRGKRPLMGQTAAEWSDAVIVTSDNPRTEEPGRIIREILEGVKEVSPDRVAVVPDRREAIRAAIGKARKDDMVVIAGKGHEDYQILGEEKIHFDDREEARAALQMRGQEKSNRT